MKGSLTAQLDAAAKVAALAQARLSNPQDGDTVLCGDGSRRYTVERHVIADHKDKGKMPETFTLRRAVPKVRGKAARKAEKRARRK